MKNESKLVNPFFARRRCFEMKGNVSDHRRNTQGGIKHYPTIKFPKNFFIIIQKEKHKNSVPLDMEPSIPIFCGKSHALPSPDPGFEPELVKC